MTLKILVVDDEKLARQRMRTLLGDCTSPRAEVGAEAANAAQAMELVTHEPFDAVLLDVHITSERRKNTVVVKVINTVPAGQGAAGNGVALDNVRDRLNLLHDVQGQFSATFSKGVFRVRIEVPG